jgi:flagellar basal body-associated protein FliL
VKKKKKLLLLLPVLLLVAVGAAYELVLAPTPAKAKPKIAGELFQLPDPFLLNLADGRYAKVSVALVLEGAPAAAAGEIPVVPQQAAVRAAVTDRLTGLSAADLIDRGARHRLLASLRKSLLKTTDNHVDEVLFTDVTVQ